MGVENSNLKPKFFDKLARFKKSRLSYIYMGEWNQHFYVPLTIDGCCQDCHVDTSASLDEALC